MHLKQAVLFQSISHGAALHSRLRAAMESDARKEKNFLRLRGRGPGVKALHPPPPLLSIRWKVDLLQTLV